ncbi:MAG: phenylalanine--tRNA ligase subunit beta [Lachnospiraceae bacterium]|nr:phenylalanine--tRNA ligase subunit beta [Lachnospiraceae bacterium]
MNTTLSWIKAYVPDLTCTAQEYTDAMTLSGTKVEGYEAADRNLDKIVIGQIEKIEKHPDSDHLIICQVNVGTETIQIVTGAPNVKEGDKIPVVLDGGRVAGNHDGKMTEGGIQIKKGKLRGVESNGMMCSIEELGSSREFYPEAPEYGIYIFPEDAVVGADAIEELGLHDVTFEYEITSNRVDCFGVIGIAREAAATFGKEFHPPVVTPTGNEEKASDYVKVTVKDTDLCPRYCARVVKNIKIAPSPKWMQRRLAAAGIRPINNIVDITNYIMEEYGQPMHAYDYDQLAGHEIIVRRAAKDEKFVTLDGQERTLDENVLVICDGEKSVGIAGIMGGENSMITDDVKTMLFEAACFDGTNIRLSSKRIGLRTDASAKFEKGLDPNNAEEAINRACQLIEELGAGEVVGGMVDVYPTVKEPVRIPFEPERINALLGTDISAEEMLGYFKKIDLGYDEKTNEVIAPTFRQDLFRTADLAEEVARFYGYANIPTTLPTGEATTGKLPFDLRVRAVAQDIAEFCGFSQGMMYSFESPKAFEKLMLPADSPLRNAIRIMNPLGEDFSIMRTQSVNGMLTSLGFNYSHRNKNVRLYELGNIYIPKALPLTELPNERVQFTLGMYGDGDFFTMKGVIEEFLDKLGITGRKSYRPDSGKSFLHPGRQADVYYGDKLLGFLGEVHPLVASAYGIGEKAYIAVLDMPAVTELATFDRKYAGIAKFPAVSRDISMVVPKHILAGEIEDVIIQRGGKILESCQLFDIYEGAQIRHGFKSMAYSITFRAKDRTLEEGDITAAMKKIWNGLESLGIEIRA